jgi:DNA-binding transcriptional LysR family regulator
MNLRALDLNLLVVLDALLDEAHVTRAAQRLAMSQPATSSALDRCRHVFKDPLLERIGSAMRLTPRALALKGPLKAVLAGVSGIVDAGDQAWTQVRQSVRLLCSDSPALAVVIGLHGRLRESAPNIDLVVMPWRGAEDAQARLARSEADLAVSVLPSLGEEFRRVEVLQESYLVAMRKGHPAARKFDLAKWLAWPHVMVSGRGDSRGAVDEQLQAMGLSRRVGMVLPSFLMVPPLLRRSDMIALLPGRCVTAGEREGLAVFEPPLPVQGFPLHLAWHARRDNDPAIRHVAQLIREELLAL